MIELDFVPTKSAQKILGFTFGSRMNNIGYPITQSLLRHFVEIDRSPADQKGSRWVQQRINHIFLGAL